MPERADLPKLQRQLDFIAEAVELFSEVGVDELKAVKRDESPAAQAEEDAPAQRPGKKGKKGKSAAADEGPLATSLDYSFQLLASPKALVSLMNRLNSEFRFTVVTELNFAESRDLISESFAAREKAESEARSAQGGRRGGRRKNKALEQLESIEPGSSDGGIVIDPEIDAPFTVDISIRVYDFGQGIAVAESASAPAAEVPAAENAPAAAPAPAADAPEQAAPAEASKEETAK